MVKLNRTRLNYLERFQRMIDDYNADVYDMEMYFHKLLEFTQSLQAEDHRRIAEGLEEEELTIFDLLTQSNLSLTPDEIAKIKQVAKDLLQTLKQNNLVLDWRKRQQSKAAVEVVIKNVLDELPESYSTEIYEQKCHDIYQHIYESYAGVGLSIYDSIG